MSILEAVMNLLGAVTGLLLSTISWLSGLLIFMHTDMPRLEGLLIGVLFAWLYVHREKNAFVRVIAAPMKIIIDILDIVWDETIEAGVDVYSAVKEFLVKKTVAAKDWTVETVAGAWTGLLAKLASLRGKLSRKVNSEKEEE